MLVATHLPRHVEGRDADAVRDLFLNIIEPSAAYPVERSSSDCIIGNLLRDGLADREAEFQRYHSGAKDGHGMPKAGWTLLSKNIMKRLDRRV